MTGILKETLPGIGNKGEEVRVIYTSKTLQRMQIVTAKGTMHYIDSRRVDTTVTTDGSQCNKTHE